MPLKLNVGLSRKVGEANYGSRGASVNVELELDAGVAGEPDRLRERIRHLFQLARASVDEELQASPSGPREPPAGNGGNGNPPRAGQGADLPRTHSGNGSGRSRGKSARPATQSQVRAIYAIAGRERVDLTRLLQDRFGLDRPEDLSLSDASDLIDELRAAQGREGERR